MASTEPFVPSLNVAPVTCPHCGDNALFIRRTPDSKGRPCEYQVFECSGCHRRVMRTVKTYQKSDAEIEALAERIAGVPPGR